MTSWVPAERAAQQLSDRQQTVLDAVVDLLLAQGFRTLGLDEIATGARCSKSTLYTLADSKSGLVARCVEHYFRRAARRVEDKVRRRRTAANRLRTYLMAVAEELETASDAFLADVAGNEITRRSYERHTWIAAERVRDLVEDGVRGGEFDPVHARFLGEVTAAAMDAIERGGITARTGLSHGQAYSELAKLVLSTLGVGSTAAKPV